MSRDMVFTERDYTICKGNAKKIMYRVTDEGCWECSSHKTDSDGYIVICRNYKLYKLHRYVYSLVHGGIDPNLVVLHTCDNRKCINPGHLVLGTVQDNVTDAVSKRRHAFGERNGFSKLTDDAVKNIRSDTRILREIAQDYGVSIAAVHRVKSNQQWKHIR